MGARIETSIVGDQLWVRVCGPGTMKIAPALARCVHQAGDAIEQVVIDLSECTWIDSTFAGGLIRLRQGEKQGGCRVVINRPSARCRSDLEKMHLHRLFTIETRALPACHWQTMVREQTGNDELMQFVITAHEDLAGADPANEPFRRVANAFRRDYEAHRQPSGRQ